jgi:SAM-dependent methyltransferase
MSENNAGTDWAGARGEKWCKQLTGMEAMMRPVDDPLIRALRLDKPYRIADIGCGGGGTSLQISHKARPGSEVCGFDISPALVEAAQARAKSGEGTAVFSLADVTTAPPPAKAFDRLVSRFGIMFFPDPPVAFANLYEWLGAGGRFAFAAWGPLEENPWMTSLKDVAAQFVAVAPHDPEAPGAFQYADTSKLLTMLGNVGFAELEVQDWRGTLPIGGGLRAPEAAVFALDSFSSFREDLAAAGEHTLAATRRLLTDIYASHEQNGAVHMKAYVRIFTGMRPVV